MFKNLLSAVGWGELPSSFGYTVGEKVTLPFSWNWELHEGKKKSDGSAVSVFIHGKKDMDTKLVAAAKNAVQMAKSLRHTHILKAFDSIETEGGFYLVTEVVSPLLAEGAPEGDDRTPKVWALYQALDALGFLHQSGFAHGLFGPAAIFVTPQGDYRLGAFELCRKDADASSLIMMRRQCCPSLVGWPEAPTSLAEGGAPTTGVDMWGAALLMAYVYGTAKAGRAGADYRVDMDAAPQVLPPALRKPFADFCKPGPLRGKNPVSDLLQTPHFQNDESVKVMSFLGSLHIRSAEEKDAFFEALPGFLGRMPQITTTKQVLPELLEAQKFPGQEAAQVLPAILKIGLKLNDEEFKAKVAPLVIKLFASPDRAIRFRLLTCMGEMIDLLDDSMINDKIFPECVNGFTDSNGPIREATVKSLIFFVPRLKAKTIEGRVVKLLVKTLQDPEASIRTNAVICAGRISSHLPKAVANQTLTSILAAGLKDNFGPCRSASLQTLSATVSIFSADELAQRLMPAVCHRLVDPDTTVSDTAFSVLTTLQQQLQELVQERRAAAAAGGEGGAQANGAAGAAEASPGGAWGAWALTTVGSVVSQGWGSMGKAESSGALATSGGASTSPTAAAPSAPVAQSPPAAAMGAAPARGMALGGGGGQAAAKPQPPPSQSLGLDGDDDIAAAGAWGDEDDFWGEFGDKPDPPPEAEKPVVPIKTAPLSIAPKAAAAKPQEVRRATEPAVGAAKATPAPAVADDDDFWKEFDM